MQLLASSAVLACEPSAPSLYGSPLLKEGKTWNYIRINPMNDSQENESYCFSLHISGDSTVQGRTYYKVWRDDPKTSKLHALMRQEDSRVYILKPEEKDERLLYDLGMQTGQLFLYDNEPLTIVRSDTVNVQGTLFLRYKMKYPMEQENDETPFTWVKGISGPYGTLTDPVLELPTGSYVHTFLHSCYNGDFCIFTADGFDAPAYHAGQADVNAITNGIEKKTASSCPNPIWYDLQGRRITGQPLRQGVYIRNGRKVVR